MASAASINEVQVLDYFGNGSDSLVDAEVDIRPCSITNGAFASATLVNLRGDGPDSAAARKYMFDHRPA